MTSTIRFLVVGVLVLHVSAPFAAGETRTWTDVDGKTLEARLVAIRPEGVTLVTGQAKQLTVPLTRLSADDRKHVADAKQTGRYEFRVWRYTGDSRRDVRKATARIAAWDADTVTLEDARGRRLSLDKKRFVAGRDLQDTLRAIADRERELATIRAAKEQALREASEEFEAEKRGGGAVTETVSAPPDDGQDTGSVEAGEDIATDVGGDVEVDSSLGFGLQSDAFSDTIYGPFEFVEGAEVRIDGMTFVLGRQHGGAWGSLCFRSKSTGVWSDFASCERVFRASRAHIGLKVQLDGKCYTSVLDAKRMARSVGREGVALVVSLAAFLVGFSALTLRLGVEKGRARLAAALTVTGWIGLIVIARSSPKCDRSDLPETAAAWAKRLHFLSLLCGLVFVASSCYGAFLVQTRGNAPVSGLTGVEIMLVDGTGTEGGVLWCNGQELTARACFKPEHAPRDALEYARYELGQFIEGKSGPVPCLLEYRGPDGEVIDSAEVRLVEGDRKVFNVARAAGITGIRAYEKVVTGIKRRAWRSLSQWSGLDATIIDCSTTKGGDTLHARAKKAP